jgi:DNA polymerase
MAAYAFDERAPKLWQPHLQPEIPSDLHDALTDCFVEVHSWNAAFERAISKHVLGLDKPIEEFRDPMANARYLSLPGSLSGAGEILGLTESQAKIKDGDRLIKLFCEPEDEGGRETLFGLSEPTFRDWRTDPTDWKLFCDYCVQDVIAERTITKKLRKFPLPEEEWKTWFLSEKINETGLPVSLDLVSGARFIVDKEMLRLTDQLKEITQLENPNSTTQMLEWLETQGYHFSSIGKAFVARALAGECDLTEAAKLALAIRGQTSKSSVKKYTAIADTTSADGRLRYAYQFMGAARTGRFSSLGANMANLAKASKAVEKNMDRAIELVRARDYDTILSEFGKPLDVATSTIRSSFQAPPGQKFVICDLAAVENRVLGWVSRCDKILDVFRKVFTYEGEDHPELGIYKGQTFPWDPYLDFATKMYGQSYAELWYEWKILGDSTKRNNAKPPVLGAGFQLGPGKEEIDRETGDRIFTGLLGYAKALGVEMTPADAKYAIQVFRDTYTEVVWYWKDIHRAAVRAVRNPGQVLGVGVPYTEKDREWFEKTGHPSDWEPRVSFLCHGSKVLEMKLPSSRSIHYIQPEVRVEDAEWEGREYKRDVIYYWGKELGSQNWGECTASPGRFTENSVQAIARDLLVHGMKLADSKGFSIVLHSYDEIGAVVPENSPLGLPQLIECMAASPDYALDLPLSADGCESPYYKK